MKAFFPLIPPQNPNDMQNTKKNGFTTVKEMMDKKPGTPGALTHGTDGYIFTMVDQIYERGSCHSLLKWKPPHLNTIDFLFKVVKHKGAQEQATATLFVTDQNQEFEFTDFGTSVIKASKSHIITPLFSKWCQKILI